MEAEASGKEGRGRTGEDVLVQKGSHYSDWEALKGQAKNGELPVNICGWFGSDDCIPCLFEAAIPECSGECRGCKEKCPCQKVNGKSAFEWLSKLDALDHAILGVLADANEWRFNRTVTVTLQKKYPEATYRRIAYRLKRLQDMGFTEQVRARPGLYGRGWRITEMGRPIVKRATQAEPL